MRTTRGLRGPAWRGILDAVALALAARAEAALGEGAEAIAADRDALGAKPGGVHAREGYTVERMQSSAHQVREFLSPSGVVFAVSWDGISHPDLSKLLGAYAGEYRRAAAAQLGPRGRRHRVVRTDRLVVETWGHMRSLHGRAYVPALVPQGVSVDDLH
jgi:hypothetical protein